jgi:LmbE family N-acetylglucosaminyl deacetylase
MSTPPDASHDAIVIQRPHFVLQGHSLFFLISRRPAATLSATEAELWRALARSPSISDLQARFADADRTLGRFLEQGFCEIAEASFPAARSRIAILEPHADDAVLSLGALMWQRRHHCHFHIITAASRSNFTSYYRLQRDYFHLDEVGRIRRAESLLIARLLGGSWTGLDLPDAPIRYHDGDWSLRWFLRHRYSVAAATARQASPDELRHWASTIRTALRRIAPDELWIPLGSPHADHQLTRNAALAAILDHSPLPPRCAVRIYQESPYAARAPAYTPAVLRGMERLGAQLTPESIPIVDHEQKLRLCSIYASQFKMKAILPELEATARLNGDEPCERLWTLASLPERHDTLLLRPDWPELHRQSPAVAEWAGRNREAQRIRVLLLLASGSWAQDQHLLLSTFPQAHLEIYAAPAALAELADSRARRARVHPVAAGSRAWAMLALRLAAAAPAPTLFIAGENRLREARWLSRLWPLSSTIVLPTMDQFVSCLQYAATAPAAAAEFAGAAP